MPKITVMPGGTSFEIDENTSLLEGLRRNGYYVKSSCGGKATCSDCVVKIKVGEDNLSSQEYPELKLVGNVFHITKERLSCQTRVTGDVVVDISNHDQKFARPYDLQGLQKVETEIKTVIRTPEEQTKITAEREQKRLEKRDEFNAKRGELGGYSRPRSFKDIKGEEKKHDRQDRPNFSSKNNRSFNNKFGGKRPSNNHTRGTSKKG